MKRRTKLTDYPYDNGGLQCGESPGAPILDLEGMESKRLTKAGAAAIYRRDYWDINAVQKIPAKIRLAAFDAAVNRFNFSPRFAVVLLAVTCARNLNSVFWKVKAVNTFAFT